MFQTRPAVLGTAFSAMAHVLSRQARSDHSQGSGAGHMPDSSGAPVSRTQQLRNALAHGGRMDTLQLSQATGLTRSLVSALLKSDIDRGRVIAHPCRDGVEYELSPSFDEELHDEIKQARALLERHGYAVTKAIKDPK